MAKSTSKKARAHYNIDENVFELFGKLAPNRQMSTIVEGLIASWCAKNVDAVRRSQNIELKKLGTAIEVVLP